MAMAADAHYTKAGGYLEKNEIRFKKPVYLNGFSKSRLVSSRIKPQLTWYMTRHVSRSTDITREHHPHGIYQVPYHPSAKLEDL